VALPSTQIKTASKEKSMDQKEFTKDGWVEQLQIFCDTISATDDDLRSFTLGAIRSLAKREDAIDHIRAALDALDEVLGF
jgi:hypothetical protein